jgi:HK97 family phage prohead protease
MSATSWELPAFVNKQAELADISDDRFSHFIASTNRVDRYGDIVEQSWDLTDFLKNPVFLFSHQSWAPPIGWVREFNPNADATATHARVEFLPPGKNARADELFELTRIRAIRAVSVGFIPLEAEDRFGEEHQWLGYRFLRSQLIELSLCTVPANADAVSLARSFNGSPRFLRRVCAETEFSNAGATPPAAAPKLVGTFQRRLLAVEHLELLKRRYPPAIRPVHRAAA